MCTYRIELTYQSWHNSALSENYGKERPQTEQRYEYT